jgi:VIT1/CCC1 family predicted Fe2+/Mn2+ transporter
MENFLSGADSKMFDFLHSHPHIEEYTIFPILWLMFFLSIYLAVKAMIKKKEKRRAYIRLIFVIITIMLLIIMLYSRYI